MAKSLQDQLLSKGLIDKKKAKTIKKAQRVSKREQAAESDESKLRAQEALLAKSERDKELNRKKNEQAAQKAELAQIKQLIETKQINNAGGEIAYQFSHGKNIKKIYVNELLHEQLVKGLIAIVTQVENYALVPRQVAEKIAQRDASFVVVLNSNKGDEADENDPYADYKIPDDLMW